MKLSNKVYDTLKYIALIALPALCVLLTSLGDIWNIGIMPKIVASVSAVDAFLGALLLISTAKYWKEQQNEQ